MKPSLPKHYVPQNAAAEFFRTATPETFTCRKVRAKRSRVHQRTSRTADESDKSETHPDHPVEASVISELDTTTAHERVPHVDPVLSKLIKHPEHIAHEADQEDYGSRNPEDRPNWTQFDANPVIPRQEVRTAVIPFLRHMPTKARAQAASMSETSEATGSRGSLHHRGRSTFGLPVRIKL